jgi:membrane-associated phospholipid phosphatase
LNVRFGTGWILAFAAWLAGMGASAIYDLAISRAWASRYDPLGAWISRWGEWPAWLVLILCLALAFAFRHSPELRVSTRNLAKTTVLQAVIHPLLITQSLKLLWGRVRFAHLSMDLSDYTPFFRPAGPGAGPSFPSGHVAMASIVFVIPIYLQRHGLRRLSWLAWSLALPYVVIVATGRILSGAHFMSDCLFSAGLALFLARYLVEIDFRRASRNAHHDSHSDSKPM